MKLQPTMCTLFLVALNPVMSNPVSQDKAESKFFFDAFPKGITISRVTTDDQPAQTNNGYSVRFVPLISLLAGMFPNFLAKLGQFTGINKYVNTRSKYFFSALYR